MEQLQTLWANFAEDLVELLPKSPFTEFLGKFSEIPYLGYLNWFVPIREILIVMASWLSAIALFYLYSIIMRWLKVIGD